MLDVQIDLPHLSQSENKRSKLEQNMLFQGNSCFLIENEICALVIDPSSLSLDKEKEYDAYDFFTLKTTMWIEEQSCVVEWEDVQSLLRIRSRINHNLVDYVRKSYGSSPNYLSLDFGKIQLRLWKENGSDFSVPFLKILSENLKPNFPPKPLSSNKYPSINNLPQYITSLEDAINNLEKNVYKEVSAYNCFESISEVLQLVNLMKRSS